MAAVKMSHAFNAWRDRAEAKREAALRGEDARAAERRRREKEAVAGGKRPFYLSKAAA